MIRVVLDTNIVVSAALSPAGPPAMVLVLAAYGVIEVWYSKAIIAEYKEVLFRDRVGVLRPQAKRTLRDLMAISRHVEPKQTVRVSPDPDDNIFLECAQAAKAHYLITGNISDFPARWKYTRVVTPRQFIGEFGVLLTSSQSQ
jgi:putative PIN family toxin of toxin-antitoxin system